MNARSIAATLLALAGLPALAAERWSGTAYALDGGQPLYRESHYQLDDAAHSRLVLYRCPDGRAFARKIIRDEGDAQAPDFELRDARRGYREGVRGRDGARLVYAQRAPDQPEKSAPLVLPTDGVIDAGFDAFVRRHWVALARGDSLRFAFLVPSKRTFYAFDLAKVRAATSATRLTLRLSLGAWYAFLAPHIDVTYDRATHRLLRFAGMSNIRDAALKNLNVRIEFPNAPAPASAAQIDAAQRAPLVRSCGLASR
jgi:hypothetical protein